MLRNTVTERERFTLRVLCDLAAKRPDLHKCSDCAAVKPAIGVPFTPANKRKAVRDIKCARGCVGKADHAYRLFSDGTQFWTCPRKYEKSPLVEYLHSYLWYEDKGTLPNSGGLESQPAKWVHAMEVIRGEFRRIERVDAERRSQDAARDRRRAKRG